MIEFTPEELDAFDTKQIMVILLKGQGLTYEEIIQQIPQLKFPKTLHTMLMSTLMGRKFIIGKTTGRPPLVGDVQVSMFKKELEERADMNRAITMFEAVTVLEKINGDYLWKNYQITKSLNLRKIAIEILNSEDIEIERSWFIQFLTRNNFSIKTPVKLEEIRDKYCHSNVLLQFYNNLIAHLPRNPNVIFNADHTASSFNGKGKVIVPDGKHPIVYLIN